MTGLMNINDIVDQMTPARNVLSGTDKVTLGAARSGHIHSLTAVSISNDDATTGTEVHVYDDTTIIWTFSAPSKGGGNMPLDPPIKGTAGNKLDIAADGTVTSCTVSTNLRTSKAPTTQPAPVSSS